MSSYSIIYVEYKRNDDWHLLQTYVPIERRDRWVSEEDENEEQDNNIITIGDSKFYVSNVIEKCGIIRDLLNDPGKEFNNRGFPDDISKELRKIFDNQQREIDILNSSQTENLVNRDWRYGKSWCYLTELESTIMNSYRDSEKNFINAQFSNELNKIYEKIDYMCYKLNPNDNEIKAKYDSHDDVEELYSEEIDDLIYARSFCDYISDLIMFVVGFVPSDNNIRLVYYTE